MAGNTAKASSATKRQYRFIRVNPPSKESSCIHHRQGGKKTYFKTSPSLVQTTGGNLLIAQVRVASLDSRTVRVPLRDTLERCARQGRVSCTCVEPRRLQLSCWSRAPLGAHKPRRWRSAWAIHRMRNFRFCSRTISQLYNRLRLHVLTPWTITR